MKLFKLFDEEGGAGALESATETLSQKATAQHTPQDGSIKDTSAKAAEAKWYDGLDEEFRTNANITKYGNLQELAAGHIALASAYGKNPNDFVAKPSEGEENGTRRALTDLGLLPENEVDYTLSDFENAPEGFTTKGDLAVCFREACFEAGVPTQAMQNVYEKVVGYLGEVQEANLERAQQNTDAMLKALHDKYGHSFQMVDTTVTQVAERFNIADKLMASGIALDPDVVNFLYQARHLGTEDHQQSNGRLTGDPKADMLTPAEYREKADKLTRQAINTKDRAESKRLTEEAMRLRELALSVGA